MTTNAIDKNKRLVASDSRWSAELSPRHLAYVDDTGFDKLANRHFAAMVFAGDGVLIEAWKKWFLAPVLDTARFPPLERMQRGEVVSLYLSLVEKPECRVLFDAGWCMRYGEEASFSGSGAQHAWDCFDRNRCGRLAISSAAALDPATGGETKYIELQTGRHNLSNQCTTLDDATRQLHERGLVMDLNTGNVTPIQNFEQTSMETMEALRAGKIGLSAPTGLPTMRWTNSQQTALHNALEKVAAKEQACIAR